MRTVEIVKTAKGWHVTRRYCGRTMETAFFSTEPAGPGKKAAKEAQDTAAQDRDEYVRAWMGK